MVESGRVPGQRLDVLVWGRGEVQLESYQGDMGTHGFSIETTRSPEDILRTCNLILTTTPSTTPLLSSTDLQAGTHITAIGSDTPKKQELATDNHLFRSADTCGFTAVCPGLCGGAGTFDLGPKLEELIEAKRRELKD